MGDYPALIDGKPGAGGLRYAYLVQCEEWVVKLACDETKVYTVRDCRVFLADGEAPTEAPGKVSMYVILFIEAGQ